MASEGKGECFPYWLSARLRLQTLRLGRKGSINDPYPSHILATDKRGNFHALGWLRIDDITEVSATVSIRSRGFQTLMTDLLEELIVYEIHGLLVKALNGERVGCSNAELNSQIVRFKAEHKTFGYCGIARETNRSEERLPL